MFVFDILEANKFKDGGYYMVKAFATTVNCIDGRVQRCVNEFVSKQENVEYIDTITLAGPSKVISDNELLGVIDNVKFRLDVSVNGHQSNYISIVGHYDCTAILEDDETQKAYILNSSNIIQSWFPDVRVEALWVTEEFEIEKLRGEKQ